MKLNDHEAAVQAVREAIAVFQQRGEGRKQATAFHELAQICMDYGNLGEGHLAADKAQALWQQEGDKKEEIKAMLSAPQEASSWHEMALVLRRLAEIVAMKGPGSCLKPQDFL